MDTFLLWQVVASIRKLVSFFLSDLDPGAGLPGSAASAAASANSNNPAMLRSLAPDRASLARAQALLPVLREQRVPMRRFGLQIVGRLTQLQTSRALGWVRGQLLAEKV